MKKIYLLGAALLSMTSLTQATWLTIYNGTGDDIKVWVNKSVETGSEGDEYVTIKNKKKKTFTGIPLGKIFLQFINDYGEFAHDYKAPWHDLYVSITIKRSKKTYLNKKTQKQEGIPKIIQTFPLQAWSFKKKDYGNFTRQ